MAVLTALLQEGLSNLNVLCFAIYLSSYKKYFSCVTTHKYLFNFITALCSAVRQISFEPILINNMVWTYLISKPISKCNSSVDLQMFSTSALFWKEGSDDWYRCLGTHHWAWIQRQQHVHRATERKRKQPRTNVKVLSFLREKIQGTNANQNIPCKIS